MISSTIFGIEVIRYSSAGMGRLSASDFFNFRLSFILASVFPDFTFTVERDDYYKAKELLEAVCVTLKAESVQGNNDIAKVKYKHLQLFMNKKSIVALAFLFFLSVIFKREK